MGGACCGTEVQSKENKPINETFKASGSLTAKFSDSDQIKSKPVLRHIKSSDSSRKNQRSDQTSNKSASTGSSSRRRFQPDAHYVSALNSKDIMKNQKVLNKVFAKENQYREQEER